MNLAGKYIKRRFRDNGCLKRVFTNVVSQRHFSESKSQFTAQKTMQFDEFTEVWLVRVIFFFIFAKALLELSCYRYPDPFLDLNLKFQKFVSEIVLADPSKRRRTTKRPTKKLVQFVPLVTPVSHSPPARLWR